MTLEEHFKSNEPFTMLQIQWDFKSTSSKCLFRYGDDLVLYDEEWISISEAIERQRVAFPYYKMLNAKLISRFPDETHPKGYRWEVYKEIKVNNLIT